MSVRKRKEPSLTIKLNRVVTEFCVLCKTGLVVKHQKRKRELSLVKLIDIAFTLRKVLFVTDDWLKSTFTKIFQGIFSNGKDSSELLLCSECLRSVSEITSVIEELVELSGDIVSLKRHLFSGNRNRRLFSINCDENESSEEIQTEVQDQDPLCDDLAEPIEASDNQSDGEEPPPKRPCVTKTVRKVKPRSSGTSGPRRNAVKLICPVCKSFQVPSDKYVELCSHLHTCYGSESTSLTCLSCNDYETSDFRKYSEHAGFCRGVKGPDELVGATPIKSRIICCDKCPGSKYFNFENYLEHYVYHMGRQYQCSFPGCGVLKTTSNIINAHWKSLHKSDWATTPALKRFTIDKTLPSIPWFCHLCEDRFENVDDRNAHLVNQHSFVNTDPVQTCNKCSFTYSFREDLLIHKAVQHSPVETSDERAATTGEERETAQDPTRKELSTVNCPICKSFAVSPDKCDEMCQHLNTSHGEKRGEKLKCKLCKVYKSQDFLQFAEHVGYCQENQDSCGSLTNVVIPIRKRLICCDKCPEGKWFNYDRYIPHVQHHLSNPFKCSHQGETPCQKSAGNKNAINTHWLIRHKSDPVYGNQSVPPSARYKFDGTPPTVPWFCHLCSSRFESVEERDVHLSEEHSFSNNQAPKTCDAVDACNFKYFLDEDLIMHEVIDHTPRVQNEDLKVPQLKEKKPTSFTELLCPCCKQTFPKTRNVGGRTGNSTYANLCRHLVSCPERTPTLQCDKCDFQSEDIRMFCEHLGGCDGQHGNIIAIDKRIISCDLCPEGTYFSFEAYFKHCVFHKRSSYKCLFPDPSSPSGLCLERVSATFRCRHWLKHISDPIAGQISSEDRFKLDPEVPPLYWFCHLCNDRFLSEDARNSHLSSEHTLVLKRTHQCNKCPSNFLITEDLSMHSILEHPEFAEGISFQVKCDQCGDIFKSKKVLQQHIKSTHENCSMPCPKCDQSFNTQKDYMDHMNTHGVHLTMKDLRHLCPECNLPFNKPIDLASHRIREHNRTDLGADPLVCVPCKKAYTSLATLRMHNRFYHERKLATFCDKCGKQLKSKHFLKKHLFNVHGEGDFPTFKCEYSECGKTFKTKKQRSNHYESQHLKTPSISCEHCGQTFYRKIHFQIHSIWHRHPGFRPFTCELCPTRRFKMVEHVKVHWKTHSPEEQKRLQDFGIRKEEVDEFRAVYLNQKDPNPECYEKTKDGGILLGKKLQGRELASISK